MEWLTSWWDGMNLLQQCFAVVAIPATVILLLQTILRDYQYYALEEV